MKISKNVRQKGKTRLSEYFKKLEIGDSVAVVSQPSFNSNVPKRIIGKSGSIIDVRGASKIVKIKDGGKMKIFIIHPIHLKKLIKTKSKEIKIKKK